ncbi:MAG TPA: methyltransferase [Isosphaeraceae bacterium]|nr:methyltransferase [Isosphaeraceae bacterium]
MAARGGEGTRYTGPVSVSDFIIGGRPLRLIRPADPDRLLDDPAVLAWNRRDDYMPYWAYLWPGAWLLAEAVARQPLPASTRSEALEIGCGLGLAGLVAVRRGLRVRFTDYDDAPLRFVADSARANGFDPSSCSAARLDWREPPAARYPLILGADVLYERRLVPLVANVLAAMLAPDGVAWIADPYRASAEGIDAALRPLGLRCETEPLAANAPELGPLRGTLRRIGRGTVRR